MGARASVARDPLEFVSAASPAGAPAAGDDLTVEGVIVINLDRRPDRLRDYEARYVKSDASALPLIRIAAVDGQELLRRGTLLDHLTPKAQEEWWHLQATGKRQHHSQLSTGAVGCFLSHMAAFQFVSSKRRPWLITEDDASMPRKIVDKLNAAVRGAAAISRKPHWWLALNVICLEECGMQADGVYRPTYFWGTNSYVVRPDTAAWLAAQPCMRTMDMQIDHVLPRIEGLDVLVIPVMPSPVSKGSNIQVDTVPDAPAFRPAHPPDSYAQVQELHLGPPRAL